MRTSVQLFLLCLLFHSIFVAASYGEALPISLVGNYLIEEQGNVREFIQIRYQTGSFLIVENQNGRWTPPVELWPVSKEEFENLLREPVTYSFSGLSNDNIALFRVPRGWHFGNFTCETGFWLMTPIGPVEVIKKK
jgi:hypothetical protein